MSNDPKTTISNEHPAPNAQEESTPTMQYGEQDMLFFTRLIEGCVAMLIEAKPDHPKLAANARETLAMWHRAFASMEAVAKKDRERVSEKEPSALAMKLAAIWIAELRREYLRGFTAGTTCEVIAEFERKVAGGKRSGRSANEKHVQRERIAKLMSSDLSQAEAIRRIVKDETDESGNVRRGYSPHSLRRAMKLDDPASE